MKTPARLRPFAFALGLATAGLLASCGGSTSAGGELGAGLPSSVTVNIPKADRFEPFLVEMAAGGTVTFTNNDTDAHTVVSMPTDPVDFLIVVPPGKSVKKTFTQPGIYGYYCNIHSDYDAVTGLIKAKKEADAYPISMYGVLLVAGDGLPVASGKARVVMPDADRFEPLTLAVKQGTEVSWSNLDSDAHTVQTDPGQKVQFKFVVPAGKTTSYTFSQPGIYAYFCDAHAKWNDDIQRVEARTGSSEFPAAMEGVVFVLP